MDEILEMDLIMDDLTRFGITVKSRLEPFHYLVIDGDSVTECIGERKLRETIEKIEASWTREEWLRRCAGLPEVAELCEPGISVRFDENTDYYVVIGADRCLECTDAESVPAAIAKCKVWMGKSFLSYQCYQDIQAEADFCVNFGQFIAMVSSRRDQKTIEKLRYIWDVSQNGFLCIKEKSGLTYADFSFKYRIPERTLKSWAAAEHKLPDTFISLLSYAVFCDLYQNDFA